MLLFKNYIVIVTEIGSLTYRLHAKAGETVLVHGASGGVCTGNY